MLDPHNPAAIGQIPDLKPCPFCGGEAQSFGYEFQRAGGYWVVCGRCQSTTRMCRTGVEAEWAWNYRDYEPEEKTDA